jgi:hypothetical protein
MSFNFKPMSDQEIDAYLNRELLKEDVYPFMVKGVEQKISNSGNPMLKIHLGVMHEGEERNIIDYLVATDQMMFKIKHFCEAIGVEDLYNSGTISPDACLKRSGKAKIGIQKGGPKENGGFYPDKNSVKDYIKCEVSQIKKPDQDEFNDDIKF